MSPPHTESVRRYYDHNTHRFLRLGGATRAQSIHRALWTANTRSHHDALDTINQVLAAAIEAAPPPDDQPRHVLDLGCGVGGTLFSLARRLPGGLRLTGVTLSPEQARLARQFAAEAGLSDICQFTEANFLDLPPLPPVDFALAVESFVQTDDPARFFAQAAGVLRPGGRLALVDDFLTLHGETTQRPDDRALIDAFRAGWHAAGLISVARAETLAGQAGLHRLESRDLSPLIRLNRPRDILTAAGAALSGWLGLDGSYWRSIRGGHALRQCLRRGLTGYYLLQFEKPR